MKLSVGPIEIAVSRNSRSNLTKSPSAIDPRKEKTASADTNSTTANVQMVNVNEPEHHLTPANLIELNQSTLTYIRNLSDEEISRRIAAVSIESLESEDDFIKAKNILSVEGILIIPNFIQGEVFERVRSTLAAQITEIIENADGDENYENDNILIQKKKMAIKGYTNLASHSKTIASVRQGADQGMIDVFNIDKLLEKKEKTWLRKKFDNNWLLSLVAMGNSEIQSRNLNLYLNKGIEKTRGFHVDDFNITYKSFVYLNDVLSMNEGPYCYVRKSNQDCCWRTANKLVSAGCDAKTEAPLLDYSQIVPAIAPKGSLVLSDQSGIHRGLPQAPNAQRQALVMRYK
ncbi:MAG: hypothetical protein ACRBCJ_12470 [Hyphomicrobiaceae bacterium]